MNAFKRLFANSTSRYANRMMILQIRPMMLELVHRAIARSELRISQAGILYVTT
ncbi:hypothetical protein [Bradyrhizobium sp. BR 10289]|uniref:hypothetical protein n=1 Tax=Bradyrhizobium sp. BR 10289 TaxID=2749993 RepID=UPI001C6547EE|nr:hypothetical protein [Bradyrhizobium sp. BR 10289]MBW7974429.1 hypothetical protein [Bradyrhizobium sp. BR 10289]